MRLRSLLLALSPLAGLGVVAWISLQADLSFQALTGIVPFQAHLLALGAFLLSLAGRGARIALLARGLGGGLTLRGARRFRSKARALTRLERNTMVGVLLVSLVHVLARLAILPFLVLGAVPGTPLAPLVAWPLLLLYTGSLLPPPGGGGAVELAFTAALGPALDGAALAGTLLWWRLYTFYLGALVGGIVLFLSLGRLGLSTMGGGWKDRGATTRPTREATVPLGR